jgi:hypothetical protein
MAWLDTLTPFGGVDSDIWKCQRCHRIVRLYDANDDRERAAMLQDHQAFDCVDDPFMDIAFGGTL